MSNDELIDMIVRQHNAQKITIKQLKIKSVRISYLNKETNTF